MAIGFGPGAEMQRSIKQNARAKRKPFDNFESGGKKKVSHLKMDPISDDKRLEVQEKLRLQRKKRYTKVGIALAIITFSLIFIIRYFLY